MTQAQIIIDYLQDVGGWVREGEITGIRTPRGEWVGYRGPRDVRQLVHDGKVDARMNGRFREVRFKSVPVKVHIEIGNYNVSYEIPVRIPQAKLNI